MHSLSTLETIESGIGRWWFFIGDGKEQGVFFVRNMNNGEVVGLGAEDLSRVPKIAQHIRERVLDDPPQADVTSDLVGRLVHSAETKYEWIWRGYDRGEPTVEALHAPSWTVVHFPRKMAEGLGYESPQIDPEPEVKLPPVSFVVSLTDEAGVFVDPAGAVWINQSGVHVQLSRSLLQQLRDLDSDGT